MENLTQIGSSLSLGSNDLSNLDGLQNLTEIGGSLFIGFNHSLGTLEGLNSLTKIGYDCEISYNGSLSNLNGLQNLDSIGGRLYISNNNLMTSLSGLDSLKAINGVLHLRENPLLTDLSALNNLEPSGISKLIISDNNILAVCHEPFICEYLNLGGDTSIGNNDPGCNSVDEIAILCGYTDNDGDGFYSNVDCDDENADINPNAEEIPNNGIDEDCDGEDLIVGIDDLLKSQIQIFPNPTNGKVSIHLPQNLANAELEIKDYSGRSILKQQLENETELNLSEFSSGIYFLLIQTEEMVWIEKLVKF